MANNNPSVTLTFAGDSKQVSKAADEGTSATDKFRDAVDKNSTSMARSTQRSATEQARALGRQRREYDRTAESFEDMVNRMMRDRRRADSLAKNMEILGVKEHPVFGMVFKQPAQEAGGDAGDAFSDGFSKSASTGVRSFLSSPALIVGAATLPGLFGPMGLVAGAAVVTGFGAAISGIGLKVAAQSPIVLAHFERLKTNVQAKMMQISKPFEQTLIDIASGAQQLFNTFAPELDKTFPQAAKDISEFIGHLVEGFRQLAPVIAPIMDAFGKILDSLGPELPGVFQNIANALIPLADAVARNSDGFAMITVFMLNLIPLALNLITAMIEFGEWWGSVWRNAGTAITDAYNTISGVFTDVENFAGRVGNFVSGVFGQMKDALVTRFREMLQGVRDWPSSVKAALGDLSRILWDAGWRLVGGLIDGIKSRFQDVMSTLKGLTSMMPSWKGPVQVDAKLLTENGRLIIGSLVDGFRQEEPDVRSYLSDLTDFIGGFGPGPSSMAAMSAAAPSDGAKVVPVTFGSDGTDFGDAMLQVVLNAIRKAGGDPSVLGV